MNPMQICFLTHTFWNRRFGEIRLFQKVWVVKQGQLRYGWR